MSSRRQRSIPLGGRYRQVSLYKETGGVWGLWMGRFVISWQLANLLSRGNIYRQSLAVIWEWVNHKGINTTDIKDLEKYSSDRWYDVVKCFAISCEDMSLPNFSERMNLNEWINTCTLWHSKSKTSPLPQLSHLNIISNSKNNRPYFLVSFQYRKFPH